MMTNSAVRFEPFGNEGVLAGCLMAAALRKRLPQVSIGLLINGRRLFAGMDELVRPRTSSDTEHLIINAGCFAKPMTATLMAAAIASRKVSWVTPVSDILPLKGSATAALAGITVRQLLNHTHGLDASVLDALPYTSTGLIDAQLLCERCTRISAPGELYSYGSAGAWLAGAVLETLHGEPYARLLCDGLEAALGPEWQSFKPEYLCPATGGEVSLSLSRWLSFLDVHCRSREGPVDAHLNGNLATLRDDPFPLPGWSPAEQAACLGWKYYGDGWFGHNSYGDACSALLRFNPESQVAFVVSAPGDAAYAAAAAVFGRLLPELANFMLPRLLKQHECAALQLDRFTGSYVRSRSSIEIEMNAQGQLLFSVRGGTPECNIPARALRPAVNDIFMPETRNAAEFPFIQFVRSRSNREFDYLWNGKQLWKRIDRAATARPAVAVE